MEELTPEMAAAMDKANSFNTPNAAIVFHRKDGAKIYLVGAIKYHALRDTQCGSPSSRRDILFYEDVTPDVMREKFGDKYDEALEDLARGPARTYWMPIEYPVS